MDRAGGAGMYFPALRGKEMEKLILEFCYALQNEPAVLALTLLFLFASIGVVYTAGIRGRRRIYKEMKEKVEKKDFKEKFDDLKIVMARIEKRVWDLGTRKKQAPLSDEIMELATNGK
jgi:hypothetical protein